MLRTALGLALVSSIAAFLLSACSGDGDDHTPGTGAAGATTTTSGGGGVGGETGGGTTTGGSGGGGGASPCVPGTQQGCYSGPDGTEDVGECVGGLETCQPDGQSWGACEGEVVPAAELCSTAADEDCDGQTPACTGATLWSERFGYAASNNHSAGDSATDAAGNTVVVGQFYNGPMDFGPAGVLDGQGGQDGFVVKLDPDGTPLWAQLIDTTDGLWVPDVDIDAQGNIAVIGHFHDDVNAGGGVLVGDSTNWDVFLVSYDADGNHRFSDTFGSSSAMDVGRAVAVGPSGQIAITGDFDDDINFGGNQLHSTSSSPDLFVAVFDVDGNHQWSRRFGDGEAQRGHGIAFAANGDVVVSGYNNGTIDFGGQPLATAGLTDIVVARLAAADGQRIWSRQFGDNLAQDGPHRVSIDGSDNVILSTYSASSASNTIDFGTGDESGYFFLVKLDSGGTTQWARGFDGLRGLSATAVDPAGAILVAGAIQGTTDFGGGPEVSHNGTYDIAIAKYDPAGTYLWSRIVGDYDQQNNNQYANGIGTDAQGFVYAAGTFGGNIHFGDQELVSGTGLGGQDVWVAKLEP